MNPNNNELSVVFVDGCFDWLRDMFLAGVDLCGVLILGAVAIGCGSRWICLWFTRGGVAVKAAVWVVLVVTGLGFWAGLIYLALQI